MATVVSEVPERATHSSDSAAQTIANQLREFSWQDGLWRRIIPCVYVVICCVKKRERGTHVNLLNPLSPSAVTTPYSITTDLPAMGAAPANIGLRPPVVPCLVCSRTCRNRKMRGWRLPCWGHRSRKGSRGNEQERREAGQQEAGAATVPTCLARRHRLRVARPRAGGS